MRTNIFLDKISKLKISVDGKAGTGKGSLCKRLAEEFKLYYCESGIYYRKLAFIFLEQKENLEETITLINNDLDILDKIEDKIIYTETIAEVASKISEIKEVRDIISNYLRYIINMHDRVIMEGRDIGTVIAPNADVKIYLSASVEVRAKRRNDQNKYCGKLLSEEEIKQKIINRDQRDENRAESPLKIPKDAILLDNNEDGFDDFYQKFITTIAQKCSIQ